MVLNPRRFFIAFLIHFSIQTFNALWLYLLNFLNFIFFEDSNAIFDISLNTSFQQEKKNKLIWFLWTIIFGAQCFLYILCNIFRKTPKNIRCSFKFSKHLSFLEFHFRIHVRFLFWIRDCVGKNIFTNIYNCKRFIVFQYSSEFLISRKIFKITHLKKFKITQQFSINLCLVANPSLSDWN